MKEKFKAWSNLKYDKAAIANLLKTIVFRDILEFQELEADLLLSWRTSGDITSRVQAEADKLSMKVFGIVEKDTNFQFPADFDEMMDGSAPKNQILIEYRIHESKYETATIDDVQIVNILLALSLDFRDRDRGPLRLVKLFARQAEASAKGRLGKYPNTRLLSNENWERKIELDGEKFLRERRGSSRSH